MGDRIASVEPAAIPDARDTPGEHVRTVVLELPGQPHCVFTDLFLDFTGTLSLDGTLLPGVSKGLRQLSEHLRITVLTADTFGTAAAQLEELLVEVRVVRNGKDKLDALRMVNPENVIAIGNGMNDALMLEAAGLSLAVIGPEGTAGALLRVADVVVSDIRDALNLILNPLRLKATLRD